MSYELIEHTADVGMRVKGPDMQALFKNAALAMFDVIAGVASAHPQINQTLVRKFTIKQQAENSEELLIHWLNELLSLSSAKSYVFFKFIIQSINEHRIEAFVEGAPSEYYHSNVEIKAATYHQLSLKKTPSGWLAEVIFDV
ncbi:MAG: archease [Candidatus Omnitrophica bacterium]|nr:archease [Candidatus Omnitrophota bacterium]